MAFVNIVIHAVWGTKNRQPFLDKKIRPMVIEHILQNAVEKGIYIDRLNGYVDHLHCLFYLPAELSISKTMQLIKGESAFWINKEKLMNRRFEWANGYFAASVNAKSISSVRNYIDNQVLHHTKQSFQNLFDEFQE